MAEVIFVDIEIETLVSLTYEGVYRKLIRRIELSIRLTRFDSDLDINLSFFYCQIILFDDFCIVFMICQCMMCIFDS